MRKRKAVLAVLWIGCVKRALTPAAQATTIPAGNGSTNARVSLRGAAGVFVLLADASREPTR